MKLVARQSTQTSSHYHGNTQMRSDTHDVCNWSQVYPSDCTEVSNRFELHTCNPTCYGGWQVQWSATLQLFNDEGYWATWPSDCYSSSPQVLICSDVRGGSVP